MDIIKELFKYQDLKYKEFVSNLTPNLEKERFIGVRMPDIRMIAKELYNSKSFDFLDTIPHFYYEENLLHGSLLSNIKDFEFAITKLNEFLPYIDNWAVCDTIKMKSFKNNIDKLLTYINCWINSPHTYTIRFGILTLMKYFLDENYKKEYLYKVVSIKSDEYYVNMAISWFIAEAMAKQKDDAIKIIEDKLLNRFTHNKAIQKCIESYRIDQNTKEYLKTLKIK